MQGKAKKTGVTTWAALVCIPSPVSCGNRGAIYKPVGLEWA